MMEAIQSSETSVVTKATRSHIQEDGIFNCVNSCGWFFATHYIPRISEETYTAQLQIFLAKQEARFLGRRATALHSGWRFRTVQYRCPQVPESKFA
jgi:hypothetical protein